MAWLTETPSAVVNAHLAMLDRLRAEEAMEASVVASMPANLAGTKRGRESLRSTWNRWRATTRTRARAPKATPADLARSGIGVRLVPRPAKASASEVTHG